jgi:hypothetical protein
MPDNWSFVAAAYGLAAIVFLGYWRRLVQKERDLTAQAPIGRIGATPPEQATHGPTRPCTPPIDHPLQSGHPRPGAGLAHPLQ